MASLLLEAHFWTHSEDVIIHPDDVGAYKFHERAESSALVAAHQRVKELYADSRGIASRLTNKRRVRHRDTFKQLEELLDQQKLCYQSWHHLNLLLLLFESGTLVTLWINFQTGNVDKLIIDKTLVGKMGSDQVVSAALTDQHLLLTHPENRVTLVTLSRPVVWPQWGRLAALEPRTAVWELPGPSTRRTERRLSLPPAAGGGQSAPVVAVWWSASVGEIQPWTPSGRDQDRANVLVYRLGSGGGGQPAGGPGAAAEQPPAGWPDGPRLELLSYCKTHHDPLLVQFSVLRPDTLYTVEQSVTSTGEVLVEHGTYDVTSAVCQQLSAITIPLTSEVLCAAISPDERRLLLGCADGSLLLHNCARQMTHMVKIQMTPRRAAWHPHSTLAFVSSETGQLRCYDLALNPLQLQLAGGGAGRGGTAAQSAPAAGLGLGQYFRFKPRVSRLLSCPEVMSQEGHVLQSLLVTFVNGPLALLCIQASRPNKGRVYPSDVIAEFVTAGRLDAAINLLTSLNWEQQGDEALAGLYMVTGYLLKRPLTPAAEAQLEAALGSYLAPVRPLSEPVQNMYGDRVRNITRRFFHHLIRHRCLEKAYRLALDLRDHDLFMDLHRAALRHDQRHLAAAALEKAEQIDEEASVTSGSESGESTSCSSDCSSSWHSGPEGDRGPDHGPDHGDQKDRRDREGRGDSELEEEEGPDDLLVEGDGDGALAAQMRAARLLQPVLGRPPLPRLTRAAPAAAETGRRSPGEEPAPVPPPLPPRPSWARQPSRESDGPPQLPPRPPGLTAHGPPARWAGPPPQRLVLAPPQPLPRTKPPVPDDDAAFVIHFV
ncbi:WD repeat-containing and planar cell polarity effector protein fritz homolog [Amphibalanus amphitrite]|uniref:WD repeat-containing and planar cell polarity effector protein fritz homolog n=1 Tax=Amphibalanus amphitrite TaxID=1232801 RepID=UPI001C8FB969|nr:WD repeat-containing and planar cell polarity effector protein fritz homolog [Amphibalanus amphitrite]XP_043206883.1 WD repeat-containing and planar cell polarity effector protein fritz homolog [Amphibalanus amphitrite]